MKIYNGSGRAYETESSDLVRRFGYSNSKDFIIVKKKDAVLIPGFLVEEESVLKGEKIFVKVNPVMTSERTAVSRELRSKLREDKDSASEMDFNFWINESEYFGGNAFI